MPFGRSVRPAVHREHHGDGERGDGAGAAGSAGAPAAYEDRDRWAVESGRAVMALLDSRLRRGTRHARRW